MLIRAIERLRGKPHHIRHRVALLGASSVTLVIAAVWVTTLPSLFGGPVQTADVSEPGFLDQTQEDFNAFKEDASTEVDAAREGFDQTTEDLRTLIELYNLASSTLSSTTPPQQTGPQVIQIATSTSGQ